MGQGPQAVSITKFSFEFSNFQEQKFETVPYILKAKRPYEVK